MEKIGVRWVGLPGLGKLPKTGKRANQGTFVCHIWLSTYVFSLRINIYPGDRVDTFLKMFYIILDNLKNVL